MFHLEEMVANRNKQATVFMGKYSFFDNDYLLNELVAIYKEKHELSDSNEFKESTKEPEISNQKLKDDENVIEEKKNNQKS